MGFFIHFQRAVAHGTGVKEQDGQAYHEAVVRPFVHISSIKAKGGRWQGQSVTGVGSFYSRFPWGDGIFPKAKNRGLPGRWRIR